MAGEEGKGYEDACREEDSLEDDLRLVEGDNDRDGVGFEARESRKEDEVCWVRLALPVGQEHETDGTKKLEVC